MMSRESELGFGFDIQLVVEPHEAGFQAYCPELDGIYTTGETEEEVLKKARDIAVAHFQCCCE